MSTTDFLEKIHREIDAKDVTIAKLTEAKDAISHSATERGAALKGTIAAQDATIAALREQLAMLVQKIDTQAQLIVTLQALGKYHGGAAFSNWETRTHDAG